MNKQELERRRFRAVEMHEHGLTQAEIARALEISRQSVSRWLRAYGVHGKASLEMAHWHGRPAAIDLLGQKRLEHILLAGPRACGYEADLWTTTIAADMILREFKIQYHPTHVWRILKRSGVPLNPAIPRNRRQGEPK